MTQATLNRPKTTEPIAREQTETILSDGKDYYDALLRDIEKAKQCIDLETYIFNKDHLGILLANALIDAAQRGVRVRILVDGAGTPMWRGAFVKKLEQSGIQTKVFRPFPWHLWNWSRSVIKLPSLLKWVYLLLKINSRNHRKTCIIDQHITFIGSLNVSRCHLHKSQGGRSWRDIGVRLYNKAAITELHKAFESAWTHRSIKERLRDAFAHVRKNPTIRLNHTRHRRRILHKHLLRRVSQCQQRIWITNAYFVPDNFLLKRLKEAASAGVDVRILLPQKSDILIMPWTSKSFYGNLLKSGARIFEYLPSMLHAKSLILDNWMSLGSSNLNHRSLLHDLEVDVNIKTEKAKQALTNHFLHDLKYSKEITIDDFNRRSIIQKIVGRMLLYLKYWF